MTGGQKSKPVKAFLQKASGILINRASEGPWRSKSVLTAFALVVLGLGFWVSDIKNGPPPSETNNTVTNAPTITSPANPHWNWGKPFPFYVPMGASYVAGFCIGWVFRKLIRLIVVTGLVVALLAFGKFAGCDTTPTQEQVKQTGERSQHEVTTAKELSPASPAVGGCGRRRNFPGFPAARQSGRAQARGSPNRKPARTGIKPNPGAARGYCSFDS